MRTELGALLLALAWLLPGPAAAQCVLVSVQAPAGSVALPRLFERLAEVSGACVVEAGVHEGEVQIELHDGTDAVVHVHADVPPRAAADRDALLPADPLERAETIAILAGNLLRDESAELLLLLSPAAPPTEAPIEAPIEAPTDAPIEAPTTEAPIETLTTEAPIETPTTEAPIESEPLPAPRRPPFLRLGGAGEIGSVPEGTGFVADVFAGLEVAWTAPEWIALGVKGLMVGATRTAGVHVDATPFVELAVRYDVLSGYVQLGAQLELRVEQAPTLEVAPLATLGARLRVDDAVSLGAETTLRVVATRRFSSLLHELPIFSLPWTFGLTVLFHVS